MEEKKKFIINAAFYTTIIALVVLTYKYLIPILMPFIIGFAVAAILQLPLRKIGLKKRKHRQLVAAGLCVAFYLIVVGLLVLISTLIVEEVGDFIVALPSIFEAEIYPFVVRVAQQLDVMLEPINPELADWIMDIGKSAVQSLAQFATNLSAGAVKWLANSAVSIPGAIVTIIITVVSTFYFAADYDLVLRTLKRMIPKNQRRVTLDTLGYAKTTVAVFIKSYSIIFVITFVELCIGLWLLKIPYAAAIALGIALFDLMPVLGTGGILLPWTVVLLVMGNIPLAIGILVLYIVITIVRQSLEPRIVGTQIGLHPLATLVAMILGLRLMGLLGMLCFPIGLVAVTNLKKRDAQETAEA